MQLKRTFLKTNKKQGGALEKGAGEQTSGSSSHTSTHQDSPLLQWAAPPMANLIPRFVRLLMVDGKKNLAYKNFSKASHEFLRTVSRGGAGLPGDGVDLLLHLQVAVNNVAPLLECRRCRVAGATRQIPAVVPGRRGGTLAMRWIVEFARKRKRKSGSSFSQCLAQELVDAYQRQGNARQRRDQLLYQAGANRGYLRYRWW